MSNEQEELREQLAALQHQQWSGWMLYLFSKSYTSVNGDTTIPREFASRWMRQCDTKYADLPESEKESDRIEADKYIPIIDAAKAEARKEFAEKVDWILTPHAYFSDDPRVERSYLIKMDKLRKEIKDLITNLNNGHE